MINKNWPNRLRLILFVILMLFSAILITSCAKTRSPNLSQEQKYNIIPKDQILSQYQFTLTLTNDCKKEQKKYQGQCSVELNSVPELYRKAFSGLRLSGKANEQLKIEVELLKDHTLTFYKVTSEPNGFYEKSHGTKRLKGDYTVPLFYYSGIPFVNYVPKEDEKGEQTISMQEVFTTLEQATYIKINFSVAEKKFLETNYDISSDFFQKFLPLANYHKKTFLYRQTLMDAPTVFELTFPGLDSSLEIVQFNFTKTALEIRRAYSLKNKPNITNVDNELLLSFPVNYYKNMYKNGNGYGEVSKKLENISFDPQSIDSEDKNIDSISVYVDFSENSVADIEKNSKNYYIRYCFGDKPSVLTHDFRIEGEGDYLAFSTTENYNSSQFNFDVCTHQVRQYADLQQVNFTFKKRYAFKRYNEKVEDLKPIFTIPFKRQKDLGFGFFTHKQDSFNEYGSKIYQKRVPVMALQDLGTPHNFKQSVYVLSGIPTQENDAAMRELLILSTKEVVDDFNKAFKRAFAGTDMQRPDGVDVIKLKVAGLSEAERQKYGLESVNTKHQVGDLDHNYIYYFARPSSGILGISSAATNPISGKIENAPVYVYGGNLFYLIDREYQERKEQKKYFQRMHINETDFTTLPNSSATLKAEDITSLLTQMRQTHSVNDNSNDSNAQNNINNQPSPDSPGPNLNHEQDHNQQLLKKLNTLFANTEDRNKNGTNSFLDSNHIKSILNGTVVGDKVEPNKFYQMLGDVHHNLKNRGHCVLQDNEERRAAMTGVSGKSIFDAPELTPELAMKIFKQEYKSTLAHEMGHSFGLRHNFNGTYDKKHFHFDDEKDNSSLRDYSSIMAYSATVMDTYDGLGPYDVRALRAGYAGIIDIKNKKSDQLQLISLRENDDLSKNKIDSHAVMNMNQLCSTSNWKEETSTRTYNHLQDYDLDKYLFCSDEDVGKSADCLRFVPGTTPLELLRNKIFTFNANYAKYHLQSKIRPLKANNEESLLFHLLDTFLYVRLTMEFAMFNRNIGLGTSSLNWMAPTAKEGLDFLISVVSAPTTHDLWGGLTTKHTHAIIEAEQRFTKIPDFFRDKTLFSTLFGLSKDSQITSTLVKNYPSVIEVKKIDNEYANFKNQDLIARGFEIDKLLALYFLTVHPIYYIGPGFGGVIEPSNYYFFEKAYEEGNNTTPNFEFQFKDSRLLTLLSDVLQNKVKAQIMVYSKDGHELIEAPMFQSDIPKRMRIYTGFYLQNLHNALSGSFMSDPVNAFNIYKKSPPPNNFFVQEVGSKNGQKHWTDSEDSYFAQEMITHLMSKDIQETPEFITQAKELAKDLTHCLNGKEGKRSCKELEKDPKWPQQMSFADMITLNQWHNDLSLTVNMRNAIFFYENAGLGDKEKIDADNKKYDLLIHSNDLFNNYLNTLQKKDPIIGVSWDSQKFMAKDSTVTIDDYFKDQKKHLKNERETLFSSIDLLSRLYYLYNNDSGK